MDERGVHRRHASTAADAARLQAEATWLRLAAGPGVARVLEHRADVDGSVELVTSVPDGPRLHDATLGLTRWVEVAVSASALLARLHALGIVVGGLPPDLLVVPPVGPPVLTSLDGAQPRATGDAAADVASLATSLLTALDRCSGDDIGRRRILDAARSTPPTAAVLARRLRRPGRARRPLPRRGVAAATAVAVVGTATLALGDGGGDGPRRVAPAPVGAAATIALAAPAAHPVPRAVGGDGHVLVWSGRRFAADTGDVAVAGDWDCDGTPTAAVLRRSTGEVAVFDTWPLPGGAVAGRVVGRAPGAVAVRTHHRDGCDELTVMRGDGTEVAVP